MTITLRILASIVLAGAAFQLSATNSLVVVNPADMHWHAKDALPPGAEATVLSGDPAKGSYDFMARFPSRFRVPMHWHTNEVRVTILSGTMELIPVEGAARKIATNGFVVIPAGLRYEARCDEGCSFVATGNAFFDIHYSNSNDDPRLKRPR